MEKYLFISPFLCNFAAISKLQTNMDSYDEEQKRFGKTK